MVASQQKQSTVTARGKFPISSHVMPGVVVILDTIAILACALILHMILVGRPLADSELDIAAIAFTWLTTVLLMNFAGLYQFDAILRPVAFSDKIILSFATTFLFLLAAAFSIKVSETFSRLWIGSFATAATIATLGLRIAAAEIVKRLSDVQMLRRNVVIVGTGSQARALVLHLERSSPAFIVVLGVFTDLPAPSEGFACYEVLGQMEDVQAFTKAHAVDDIIIALPWSEDQQIAELVDNLRELPVNVYLSADLAGYRMPFRQPPDHFSDVPLVEVMGQPLAGWGQLRKMILDFGLGTVLTVALLPLMAMIAIAVKLDSNGPVLFRQKRYGFVNNIFEIYKFRTMKHESGSPSRTVQATKEDVRVTRVGRFLRRTSLDELPQLFNVLNGTMSLVGPRPHAIDHNEEYSKMIRGYFARHKVKPGITGWAQVNGLRGETTTVDAMEARVKYDIYYVENWTLLFDLQILAKTAVALLTRRNAY